MVRAGIGLAVVGVLIAAAGALLYAHVVSVPQLSPDGVKSVTWVSWALAAVFVISGAGAIISTRKRRGL